MKTTTFYFWLQSKAGKVTQEYDFQSINRGVARELFYQILSPHYIRKIDEGQYEVKSSIKGFPQGKEKRKK